MRDGFLSISHRRRLLDRDLTAATAALSGLVLDLGGEWQQRRGTFRPPQRSNLRWLCVNRDPAVEPDVIGDVAHVPLAAACADAVLCTEVLEHVPCPEQVLAEIHRLLRPGGQVIASVPFLAPLHPDPYDYQRYTAVKLSTMFTQAGLDTVDIRPQGLYFTVLADLIWSGLPHVRPTIVRWILALAVVPVLNWLTRREASKEPSVFVAKYVAGYFITARKRDS